MSSIKTRVMQLLECKRIPKEKFFEKIGAASSNFRSKAAETPLGSDKIANILAEIPDVNLEWLITGKGEMFKQPDKSDCPILISTNEDRLWAMIDFLKQQIKEQQETINTLSRTNEDLTKKVGNGVQFHAAKAGE